ncbi:alpha-glycosidase [Enterococcus saccharolyticus]|jgi:glycosidase|uniref:Alpha-glycosidase n=1 Tax=Candidatus Enterococcus willemsii TaxID=1857215 RepID=A0ABQ6Z2I8_9ENTE|nr:MULTISPECIES: glycoside hydrolase family 13 protein [Enterococcus]KAF1305317.1 alpha-glycosidase [Enterococcus sp. CU12B]MCD5002992.1 alpha-glycosidase [Enterococcus saccharolyticus]OQO83997.1 alpha-glycosidase [Enterococcus casseliflavus]
MNTAAIYHRPDSEFAYLYTKDTMHIRLRTARGDIRAASLIHGDPYKLSEEKWYEQSLPMTRILTTDLYDYWFVTVTAPFKRLSYAFSVTGYDELSAFYGDHGVYPLEDEFLEMPNNYFRMPYFQEIDRFKAPEWVKQTVWYQIFPERFANGDPSNDPEGTLAWGSQAPDYQDFFGGDLQGVIDHLDYLEDLGINGLYFCPIFEAFSNHKYDTIDYLKIDPAFGDAETFKKLVDECHKRGMKVMLDAVFNHMGDTSPQWQDVLENGEQSKYADWFHVNEFPASYKEGDFFEEATDITYDVFAFTPHMPKLNTANPEVQDYLLNIAKYWIEEFDIDAWRLDVANEVDHAFWKKFRQVCDEAKEDFYILGEIWHSSQSWLQGDEFHAVMNYAFTDAIMGYFVKNELTMSKMVSEMNNQLMLYREQTNQMQFNVLDSHDTPRLLTETKGDKDLMKQVMAFTYIQQGVPCLYYGDEIGMTGEMDPDCRKCMVWEEGQQDLDLHQFVKELIAIRKDYQKVFSEGKMIWQSVSEETGEIIFTRELDGVVIQGIFNTGSEVYTIKDTGEVLLANGVAEAKIAPKGFILLLKNNKD